MAPWDSPGQRETWAPPGRLELLGPRARKEIRAQDLLSKEKREKRAPWARRVPRGETAAKACGGSRESRGCLVRWACGDPKAHPDPQDFLDPLALRVSRESEEKREPEEKRGIEAWMDSPESVGTPESRDDPALPACQGPRERRAPWGLQDLPGYRALWCRERA